MCIQAHRDIGSSTSRGIKSRSDDHIVHYLSNTIKCECKWQRLMRLYARCKRKTLTYINRKQNVKCAFSLVRMTFFFCLILPLLILRLVFCLFVNKRVCSSMCMSVFDFYALYLYIFSILQFRIAYVCICVCVSNDVAASVSLHTGR